MVAPRTLALAIVLFAGVVPALAQTKSDALSPDNILVLHRAGLSASDILDAVSRRGALAPTPEQRVELKAAGVPDEVLARIAPPPAKTFRLDDVLALLAAGVSESDVIEAIQRSGREFPMDLDRTVELVRHGVPPAVLKALREARSAAAPTTETPLRTLQDVVTLVRAGVSEAVVLRRIGATRPPLSVDVDDLITLSGEGLSERVLKALLDAGRASAKPLVGEGSSMPAAHAEPDRATARDPSVFLHEEPGDGFSLFVPMGWSVHREQKGHNSLVSFTNRPIEGADDLPDGELQIFRFVAKDRNNLTKDTLPAIAENFLGRLLASYRARGATFEHRRLGETMLAGSPAIRFDVTSATNTGRNQRGEIYVTYRGDVVYVLASAVVPGSAAAESTDLSLCVKSFGLPHGGSLDFPTDPTQRATVLFDLWKRAVTENDAGLYDRLATRPADATLARRQFCELVESIGGSDVTVELAGVARTSRGLTARVEVGRGGRNTDLTLVFQDVGGIPKLERP